MALMGLSKPSPVGGSVRPVGHEEYRDRFGSPLGTVSVQDTPAYAIRLFVDATYTYISLAEAGQPDGDTDLVWQVRRVLTDGSPEEGTTHWADGNAYFDNRAVVDAADAAATTFS